MIPLGRQLGTRFRVLAPDLPGFGRSDKPDQMLDVRGLADALGSWIDAVGIERAPLVANSLGCQVVCDLAVRHPERVERLVLVGPTVDPDARSGLRQFARWLPEARRDIKMAPLLAADYVSAGTERALATYRAMLEDRIEDKLPHIGAPALVVRGERDRIAPQRWVEEMAALLPRGRLVVVPRAGHAMNFHAPAALTRVVTPFLADRA